MKPVIGITPSYECVLKLKQEFVNQQVLVGALEQACKEKEKQNWTMPLAQDSSSLARVDHWNPCDLWHATHYRQPSVATVACIVKL